MSTYIKLWTSVWCPGFSPATFMSLRLFRGTRLLVLIPLHRNSLCTAGVPNPSYMFNALHLHSLSATGNWFQQFLYYIHKRSHDKDCTIQTQVWCCIISFLPQQSCMPAALNLGVHLNLTMLPLSHISP